MSHSNKKSDTAVTVCVRIRPRNEKELSEEMPVCFSSTEDGSGVIEYDNDGTQGKVYPFDHAFGPHCNNQYIYQTVGSPLVDSALDGFNTVLFMYGQTSSGIKVIIILRSAAMLQKI
jgi:hypothetical protein